MDKNHVMYNGAYNGERIPLKEIPEDVYNVPTKVRKFTLLAPEEQRPVRSEFRSVRSAFLKHLAKTRRKSLEAHGITRKQIKAMSKGEGPPGWHVHHILPIAGGGGNDFENLSLVKADPVHADFHNRIITPQTRGMEVGESRMIKIPMPPKVCSRRGQDNGRPDKVGENHRKSRPRGKSSRLPSLADILGRWRKDR